MRDVIDKLRELADEIDAASKPPTMPAQKLTLAEAVPILRAELGKDAYFSVSCVINCHSRNQKPKVTWGIYHNVNGEKTFDGPTLDTVIAVVRASLITVPAQTIAEADAVIDAPALQES